MTEESLRPERALLHGVFLVLLDGLSLGILFYLVSHSYYSHLYSFLFMNDHFKPGILAAILYLYEPILLQMLIHVVFVMVFLIFFYLFISLIGSRYEFVKK